MDRQLADRLNALTEQNKTLRDARNAYLLKEAERKHFEATLIQGAAGKSHAERTINAQAAIEWFAFHVELALLQGAFEFEKLKYEILDKAWTSEYGTFKVEEGLIRKHKEA
jgi:hypothetical protein